jgi:gamma-glutamyl:cysteine ligase YbdK (ATP-grasp superfamily)
LTGSGRRLGLWEGTGVELEYMIVDRDTLDVRPLCDRVLEAAAGRIVSEVERGRLAWSNELVLHVLEFKTNGPAPTLRGLGGLFARSVREANEILTEMGARLMPTAMHPWMDPLKETVLWPHEYSPVYEAYDRIFGCGGHGWSNLQSAHLNLPFADDPGFGKLHAAARLVLPLLPGLAASSPVVEGRPARWLDSRMEFYRNNSRRIPSVAGDVIPEPVLSRAAYVKEVLEPMWQDVAPYDPEGVLRDEFLNSRGAIARFGRGSLEIRVIDMQECPAADLAVAALTVAACRLMAEGDPGPPADESRTTQATLVEVLRRTVEAADGAVVDDGTYLAELGLDGGRASVGDIWRHLLVAAEGRGLLDDPEASSIARRLLDRGPLARQILRSLGVAPWSREALRAVFRELCDCLSNDELFLP